ncbi:MAG: hypothetical protein AAGC64_07235 [Bacteroidota bacterium]
MRIGKFHLLTSIIKKRKCCGLSYQGKGHKAKKRYSLLFAYSKMALFGYVSMAERLHGKLLEMKITALGYRTFEKFKSAVRFFHGEFDLFPHKNQ